MRRPPGIIREVKHKGQLCFAYKRAAICTAGCFQSLTWLNLLSQAQLTCLGNALITLLNKVYQSFKDENYAELYKDSARTAQ